MMEEYKYTYELRKRILEDKKIEAIQNEIKNMYIYKRNNKEKFIFEPIEAIDKINNIGIYIEDAIELMKSSKYKFDGLFLLKKTNTRGCSLNIDYWRYRPNRTRSLISAIKDIKYHMTIYHEWMDKIIKICEELKIKIEQENKI